MKDQKTKKTTDTHQDPPLLEESLREEISDECRGHELDSYAAFMNNPGHSSTSDSLFFAAPSSRSTHWSIAWSDLMMTMFVLFMVMFIYKSADKEFLKGEGLGFSSGPQLGHESTDTDEMGTNNYFQYANKTVSRVYDISRQLIRQEDLKDFAAIDLEADKTLRIVLTGDLLFDPGDVALKKRAQENLMKIATILYNTPYMINIIGHTDDLPVNTAHYPSNWELSSLRASSVARFLIDETRLPPYHFYVTGHSYYQPIAPNDSPTNRAKNRRVEIVLTKLLPLQAAALDNEINSDFPPNTSLPHAQATTSSPEIGGAINAF